MKNYCVFFYLCLFTLVLTSCSNDELLSESTTELNSTENKDAILNELSQFTQYSVSGAIRFYDSSNDFLDLDKLDNYILNFNFSNNVKSRSTSEKYNAINYEDALKEILSIEAYNLLSSYLSSPEKINKESFDKLKEDFSQFSNEDKKIFDLIYSATYVIWSELTSFDEINTRAVKHSLACNISTALAGSAAGWIWGAAFGGPVGIAINVAWGVAATVAAYYTC